MAAPDEDQDWSDDEIDALLDEAIQEERAAKAIAEERAARTSEDRAEQAARPTTQVDRPRASRALYGPLVLVSSLFPLIVFGTAAAVAAFGPELLARAEGGELNVDIAPFCDRAPSDSTACFENATVTYRYASGTTRSYSHGQESVGARPDDAPTSYVDVPNEARVSVRVETDRGVWTREYWIPAGSSRTLHIDPDTPKNVDGVIGRQTGAALLPAAGAAFALLHIVAAYGWLKTGGAGAANALLVLLGIGIVIQAGAILLPAFTTGSLPFVPLLVLAWTVFLARGVYLWIESNERPGREATDGTPLTPLANEPID